MQYEIIGSNSLNVLTKTINSFLKKGWRLYGKPFYRPNKEEVCQAIILNDDPKEEKVVTFKDLMGDVE